MAVKLLSLYLLLVVLHLSQAKESTCLKFERSCDSCIQGGSKCAWCTDSDAKIRCHSVKGLRKNGCSSIHIYNPQGSMQVVKNDISTDLADAKSLFLQPQEVSLHLRPGVRQSFSLTMSMPIDLPATDLTMDTSNVPEGVDITFSSMTTGNPLLVQVNVEATNCPSEGDSSNQNRTGPWSVLITPRGFSQSVKLNITLLCQCNCSGDHEANISACNGHGDFSCGRCICHMPYIGKHCEVNTELSEDERACQSGPNAQVCSGRGACLEGFCECTKPEDLSEVYSGRYCECSNFDCPRFGGRICGGRGRCECGRCVCDVKWTGEDCSCLMDTASCMAINQQLCNGRGMCECGSCRCDSMYAGPTCEECPTCTNRCDRHDACVACRAFGKGPNMNTCDTECGYITVKMVEMTDDLPGETEYFCKMRKYGICYSYTIPKLSSGRRPFVSQVKKC